MLLELAIAQQLPVLGICRGTQVINAYFGGAAGTLSSPKRHVATEHSVNIEPSRFATLFEPFTYLTVNSFHNDGIVRLGGNLLTAATAVDGQVEGLEHTRHPIVGLMWHPERSCTDADFYVAHAPLLHRLMRWRGSQR